MRRKLSMGRVGLVYDSSARAGKFMWDIIRQAPVRAPLLAALAATCALLLLYFVSFFIVARGPFAYAAPFEDDFFYYVVIAQNIVDTGRSTFDGVTLSNGYHPLWMACIVVLAAIFGTHAAAFFISVWAINAALVLAGVWMFMRLCARAAELGAIRAESAVLGGVFYGVSGVFIAGRGMEVALVWLFAPWLLERLWKYCASPTLRNAVLAATAAVLLVLSRLDMAVAVAPVLAATAWWLVQRNGWRRIASHWPAALTALPILAYLLYNQATFGAFMPISGAAKRLMRPDAPLTLSEAGLGSFFHAYNSTYFVVPIGALLLSLAGVCAALATPRLRRNAAVRMFLLFAAGVALFYLQTFAASDWPLWRWYHAALCLVGAGGAVILIDLALRAPFWPQLVRSWTPLVLAGLFAAVNLYLNAYQLRHPPTETNALFVRGMVIREFALTHPGRYAMGDGAGVVAYLSPHPFVQMEGLVNDAALIDEISAEGSIFASLRRQNVDYYIAASPPLTGDRCVDMAEPGQPGPRAPRLRERICLPPALSAEALWLKFSVYDVRGAPSAQF